MKVINIPLLDYTAENDFRDIFENEFVGEKVVFKGYPVLIIRDDFDHVFFEKAEGNIEKGQFGIRRAKRMMLIKAICEDSIPYLLLWEEDRVDKEICVLCEEAETAIYLAARTKSDGGRFFILKTLIAFGSKIESKIKTQKQKSKEIKDVEVLFKEAD